MYIPRHILIHINIKRFSRYNLFRGIIKSMFGLHDIIKMQRAISGVVNVFKGSNCLLKGDLSPIMLKKIFHNSFKNFEISQDLYRKPCKRDWVAKVVFLIQMILINRYFWDVRLKILRLPNFSMLFQLVLTKLNCFLVYWKLIMWSRSCKGPIMNRA